VSYLDLRGLAVGFPAAGPRGRGARARERGFSLRDVSFSIEQGQTLVLLGPSGAGKSVLLETLAGFHRARAGQIWLCGRDITFLPPEERGMGLMFQDYALFPHLTVEANVAFGLRRSAGRERRVDEALGLVGARHLVGRRPATLSGGEKQRVALARALAVEPRLFLFDEPLSALDATTREGLREELRGLLRSLNATSIYVTHDHVEALALGDAIAVIRDGAIQQLGPPHQVFARPADAWVAAFVGMQVICPEALLPGGPGRALVRLGDGTLEATCGAGADLATAWLAFRPEDLRIERLAAADRPDHGGARATVEAILPVGPLQRLDLCAGARFSALLGRRECRLLGLSPGDRVAVSADPDDLLLVPPAPEGRY
jgi:ABC-type Fe3+/spermidine/putrescine transport system ATPase subunit